MSTKLLRSAQSVARFTAPASSRQAFTTRPFHTTLPKMTVHNIETVDGFKEAIAKNDVVMVDWFATWCGPCKAISPAVAKWSNEMPNIHFAKVDVDAIPELAQEYGIRAMPTFTFFKNGEKVDEFVGANPPALQKLVAKYNPEDGEKAEATA